MAAKPYKHPQKRELMAGSRLEIDMLEYSLKEANAKLEKKTEELERVTGILEKTVKLADQRAEKLSHFTEVTAVLNRRLAAWKMAAILEGGAILAYVLSILVQGVV